MTTPLKWEIHYADGTIVTSEDSSWDKAPPFGVQVVIQWMVETYPCYVDGKVETRHYRNLMASCDYYWMGADGLLCAGYAGDPPPGTHVKEGKLVDEATWMSIYNAAYSKNLID